jgi:hypothetical protein
MHFAVVVLLLYLHDIVSFPFAYSTAWLSEAQRRFNCDVYCLCANISIFHLCLDVNGMINELKRIIKNNLELIYVTGE